MYAKIMFSYKAAVIEGTNDIIFMRSVYLFLMFLLLKYLSRKCCHLIVVEL